MHCISCVPHAFCCNDSTVAFGKQQRFVFFDYCIKPTLLVRYKHVLTGENRTLTGENVYLSVNSHAVNDWLCMLNILDLGLPCKQCMLNVCPCQYQSSDQHGCMNLYHITTLNPCFGSSLMT